MKKAIWVFGTLCCAVVACLALSVQAEEEADTSLVEVVIGLLHDKDKDIRALALEQIRTEAKGSAATKLFAAELRKLPPEAQVGLVRALAGRADATARTAMLELLTSTQDDTVKVTAIEAIGSLGNAEEVPLLANLLGSSSAEERKAARGSLVRVQGETVPKLIVAELQSKPEPALRIALIEILAERRGLDAIPALLELASGQEASVRVAAMTALSQMAGPEHIPELLQGILAAEPGRERDAAEKALASVCGRIEDPRQRAEPVLAAMKSLSAGEQVTLLTALGRVGGSAALALVESMITKDDTALHEAGVRALCNWPDASVASRLQQIAQSDQSEALRIAALRALIRVAPLEDSRSDEARLAVLKEAMQMASRDEERLLALDRARTIRTLAALHFVVEYLDQPKYSEQACLSVVELAHHRTLRQPNKAEFDRVLDQVIATSKDAVVVDRAQRYKKDQTWVRPAKGK